MCEAAWAWVHRFSSLSLGLRPPVNGLKTYEALKAGALPYTLKMTKGEIHT